MTDNTDFTPELTLTPNLESAAAEAKAPEAPSLTLTPDAPAAEAQQEANAVQLDESQLTEAERKMVDDFAQKIDITDSNLVLQYGAAAQKNIAGFSESTLKSVRTRTWARWGRLCPPWWWS